MHNETKRNSRFLGLEDGLESHTYTLGYQQTENFMNTTKAVSNHVVKTYKNKGDVKRSIDQLDK